MSYPLSFSVSSGSISVVVYKAASSDSLRVKVPNLFLPSYFILKDMSDCNICLKKVYMTERVEANGVRYHRTCFKVYIYKLMHRRYISILNSVQYSVQKKAAG